MVLPYSTAVRTPGPGSLRPLGQARVMRSKTDATRAGAPSGPNSGPVQSQIFGAHTEGLQGGFPGIG